MLLAICEKKLAIFASTGNYFRPCLTGCIAYTVFSYLSSSYLKVIFASTLPRLSDCVDVCIAFVFLSWWSYNCQNILTICCCEHPSVFHRVYYQPTVIAIYRSIMSFNSLHRGGPAGWRRYYCATRMTECAFKPAALDPSWRAVVSARHDGGLTTTTYDTWHNEYRWKGKQWSSDVTVMFGLANARNKINYTVRYNKGVASPPSIPAVIIYIYAYLWLFRRRTV